MDLGLKDKVAVVGASSKGLGKAIALGLGRREREGDNLCTGCGYIGSNSHRNS